MLKLKVKFTRIGRQIHVAMPCPFTCTYTGNELPSSINLSMDDLLLRAWFGKRPDRLFKNARVIIRKVDVSLMYDRCDMPGRR